MLHELLCDSAHNRYADEELAVLPVFFFSLFGGLILIYGSEWHSIESGQIKTAVKRMLNWKG